MTDATAMLAAAGYGTEQIQAGLDYADRHGWTTQAERGALALARILYTDEQLADTPCAPWAPCDDPHAADMAAE